MKQPQTNIYQWQLSDRDGELTIFHKTVEVKETQKQYRAIDSSRFIGMTKTLDKDSTETLLVSRERSCVYYNTLNPDEAQAKEKLFEGYKKIIESNIQFYENLLEKQKDKLNKAKGNLVSDLEVKIAR